MTAPEIPFVVEGDGGSAAAHLAAHRPELRRKLTEHGALLLRGFAVGGVDGFEACVQEFSGAPLTYTEQSSPRSVIKGKVYTSTEYPANAEIPLHNEMSYQAVWPMVLYFHCVTPPETQGATPLASVRAVHEAIDPAVREEFRGRKWSVVRNYGNDIGLRWWQVFGTEDRAEVQRQCATGGLHAEWQPDNGLRTRAVREPIHRHPVTGAEVWFNHVVLFHNSSLPAEIRESMLEIYGEDGLPSNTYYGDGGTIPDDVVDHLRQAYRSASTRFDYQRDDVVLVDNMLVAHGREPFTGPRKIAVAMGESSAAFAAAG
ncbi:TauD/TfdA family dioxygenase [Crossiella sp. CA198]|uniref:TauD/TfdA family dioxygenase n=1 Tax=Crossiella sp. CA198 TaxID=3455607 RepID=UPI003F8D40D7